MAPAAGRRGDLVAQRRRRTHIAGSGNVFVRVLITGTSGQIGGALHHHPPPGAELRTLTHAELDISDDRGVEAALAAFRPDVVINAAAYTAVDRAEDEFDLAAAIN